MPRAEAWQAYCLEAPPLQTMVQAYLGIKPAKPTKLKGTAEDADKLLAMLQRFPGSVPKNKPGAVSQPK